MKILFVCKHNVGRSQMAAAFYNSLTQTKIASSAGIAVDENEGLPLHDDIIGLMTETGIDISDQRRTQLRPSTLDDAQEVIVILQKDQIAEMPDYLSKSLKVTLWDVADGKGKSLEFQREMRNQVMEFVKNYLSIHPLST